MKNFEGNEQCAGRVLLWSLSGSSRYGCGGRLGDNKFLSPLQEEGLFARIKEKEAAHDELHCIGRWEIILFEPRGVS